ncbi:MAG: VWA domain-containing protein [Crocinitomicaceae bacterium]|nr:VWA domain-containing protein [Flavobacteriales bacterium]NQZ35856.1 VWA domain-containing protein [Crocinitomicaceae bacterium]
MKQLILFSILVCSFFSLGQVKFNITKHDFGDLEPYSARYVDLKLSNTGQKQEWLLRVKKTVEVSYIVSKQIIDKDSSIIIRLHVNPTKKGRFNYSVDVFTSDRAEPVKVKLTGNLSESPQNGSNMLTQCPTFSDRAGGRNPNQFDLTVVTIDKESKEPLSRSNVTLIQNGEAIWVKSTDKKGKIVKDATLGLSYFYATHEGYYPAELGAYINFKRNYIVVELEKDKTIIEPDPFPTDIAVVEPPEEEIIIEIEEPKEVETHLEEELAIPEDTPINVEAPPAFNELDPEDFTDANFKPINVVFVLDVSSSMSGADKMELMKYSLYQLIDMLRPQDKIGIVTYSSKTRVLLKSTTGENKDEIKEIVRKLRPGGYTSGGAGIKSGYKLVSRATIDDGVNHVIVITDGAFNRNSGDYKKYVRKYKRRGINLSVVGIKNKEKDEVEMRDAAKLGGGSYIPIFKLVDAQNNLKQQIRALTFKHSVE